MGASMTMAGVPLKALPDPGERSAARYSQRPFPAYRYVPGFHPHPLRDPDGHSYRPVPTLNRHAPWSPADWRQLDDWLYGVDLFNHFYFWEAHEAWEGLWASCARGRAPALLLQGLIQIAAALLKTHMGVVAGARNLSREGIAKVERAGALHGPLMGVDPPALVADWRAYFAPLEDDELPAVGPAVPLLRLSTG